jgi:hypothetical protein
MAKGKVKTQASGKSRKSGPVVKTRKVTRVQAREASPSEEEIRMKAEEIYYERISRGEHGTPESDWHEAERLLR